MILFHNFDHYAFKNKLYDEIFGCFVTVQPLGVCRVTVLRSSEVTSGTS